MSDIDSDKGTKALPTLAVVIPAFNEEPVIKACLDALYAQKSDIEQIFVVDNNSTDSTADEVNRYAKRWPELMLISEKTPGVVSARNTGFNAASSDVIARIDADTIVEPGWATAYKTFFADESNKNVGASTGMAIPYDLPFPKMTELIYKAFVLQSNRLISRQDTLFGTNMAITKNAWRAIRKQTCRKARIMEDMDIGLHLRQHGFAIKAAPKARATFSARRMVTNPISYFQYGMMWPATYWHHGMKVTAILAWPFMLAGSLLQAVFWPLIRSYDPAKRRFSIKRMFSRQTTRMIPKGH